ncbi:MAG: HD domain-containing protein [Methanomassiliicoccales archaeon]|nr:MAG: HD domain-containing protein [Methanomassiliicoccales archaeon]
MIKMEKKYIADLVEGEQISNAFYVSFKRPVRKYANGYMFEVRVGDRTGEMMVKYFGPNNQEAVQVIHDSIRDNDVVLVTGHVKTNPYNNQLEIVADPHDKRGIKKIGPNDYELEWFVPRSEKDIEGMYAELMDFARSVEDSDLRRLLLYFFEDEVFAKRFKVCPAAIKQHGNVVGGLVEHTLAIVQTCHSLSNSYPELERDLLITGAMLHDIGKIDVYEVTTNIHATDPGRLMDHLYLGAEMVRKAISSMEGFPEVLGWKVVHIVLSSHNKREYGSPIEPMFPEALAVSVVDDLEARLDKMIRLMKKTNTEDDWTYREDVGSIYLKDSKARKNVSPGP